MLFIKYNPIPPLGHLLTDIIPCSAWHLRPLHPGPQSEFQAPLSRTSLDLSDGPKPLTKASWTHLTAPYWASLVNRPESSRYWSCGWSSGGVCVRVHACVCMRACVCIPIPHCPPPPRFSRAWPAPLFPHLSVWGTQDMFLQTTWALSSLGCCSCTLSKVGLCGAAVQRAATSLHPLQRGPGSSSVQGPTAPGI